MNTPVNTIKGHNKLCPVLGIKDPVVSLWVRVLQNKLSFYQKKKKKKKKKGSLIIERAKDREKKRERKMDTWLGADNDRGESLEVNSVLEGKVLRVKIVQALLTEKENAFCGLVLGVDTGHGGSEDDLAISSLEKSLGRGLFWNLSVVPFPVTIIPVKTSTNIWVNRFLEQNKKKEKRKTHFHPCFLFSKRRAQSCWLMNLVFCSGVILFN
jgi:hypothetical protein